METMDVSYTLPPTFSTCSVGNNIGLLPGNHIPASATWDCSNHLPFTQCSESAGFTGYGYGHPQDTDLYVAGDLHENNVVTPAMIMVPLTHVVCDYDIVCGGEDDPTAEQHKKVIVKVKSKTVDEDLYKISPELLRAPPRRKSKGWWRLLSMCMQPS